jgi:hypothetical protein
MICMHRISNSAINLAEALPASALTLRGIDPALRAALEAEAGRLGLSLNAVALKILRDSLGLAETADLFHDLDALAGAWTTAEAEAFAAATQAFEEIDLALWPTEAEPS